MTTSPFDPRTLGARCDVCPRKRQKPVPSDGNPVTARVIWLGQDPGQREVEQGKPFVGPTGTRTFNIWDRACKQNGVQPIPRSEIYIMNAAACMPITKRESEAKAAMTCCRPRALAEIKQVMDLAMVSDDKPLMVLTMGKWALFALTGEVTGMGKLQGFHVPVDLDGAIREAHAAADAFEHKAKIKGSKPTQDIEDDIPF